MISVPPITDTDPMNEHPWTGLTREDLEEAYPLASECTGLGHPFIYSRECLCGMFYLTRSNKKMLTPDESCYMDPPDPRDWT